MTRTSTMSHRRLLAAFAVLPFALAACSDQKPAVSSTTSSGPTVVPTSMTTESNASTPSSSPIRVVSYSDAESAYNEGRFGEATEMFESYVAIKPENPWGHYMLGLSAWKSGDLVRAEAAFDRSLQLDSTQVKSYLNSARVLLDLGRNHEALDRARAALTLDASSVDARRLIARAFHGLGQIDSAIQGYREALIVDDRDVWAMNNLGVLYLDQGQPEAALLPLARAAQLKSTSPVFQNNLGIALERTGHIVAARKSFEAAVAADSTYSKAAVSLARVNALEVDSTDVTSLDDIAEEFRIQLGMWKDSARVPVVDSVVVPTQADTVQKQ
ncbi:MAG: tetratricopeptide repeat protein [Gemmatimonadota bacterium]